MDVQPFQPVKVFCHAGYRGEEYPKSFQWETNRVEIEEVEKCWLEPDFRFFLIKSKGGRRFLLRCREMDSQWQAMALASGSG
jgi:hypothetical protein